MAGPVSNQNHVVQAAEGPLVYLPREEVGLLDLALVLVQQRYWLILGLLLGAGWAVLNYLPAPIRYESRTVIKIGRSRSSFPIKPTKEQQDMLLEPVAVAALRAREQFGPGTELSREYQGAAISQAVFDKEADELLTLFARGTSASATQEFLAAVAQDFVTRHRGLFAPAREAMQARIERIGLDQQRLATELASFPEASAEQPAQAALLRFTRAELFQQQLELEQEVVRLQRDLADLQSPPTEILVPANLPDRAVEPSLKWALFSGLAAGVFCGISLAFSVDFLQRVRARAKSVVTS